MEEEFVEIYNAGDEAVSLVGWTLSGVGFEFPDVVLAPGTYLVVAANEEAFATAHPDVDNFVAGWSVG